MFDKLIFVSLALQMALASQTASKAKTNPTPCAAANPGATNCAADSCNVEIGGQTFCSKCTGDKVPVNGECKAKTDAGMCTAGTSDKAGTCTACTGAHSLYKGGCYDECPYGPTANERVCADAPAGCDLPNCKSCPDGTCTECNDGFVLGDDKKCVPSSVNKSGLSTGAIAGIAVAAVIVVGGLVGFLCWWFLCRGKA
ncbi:VSP [Giardia duodenalis]|uniref:VSP n=1 Tax=Giardia intestinalis (strain ATCC 50803 / WB clone C6) TaxID=184922 RepID=A8B7T7_GIAIC|nr:VSP [Giardia intestinalis]KAE8305395.1 VSP [Giardia intestinalis]|eukprot:XP_001708879.1 VSP [Giardia lamblia ATCC 50803]